MSTTNYLADYIDDVNNQGIQTAIANSAKQAIRFSLPEGGTLITIGKPDKNGEVNISEFAKYIDELRLPYSETILEFELMKTRFIVLCRDSAEYGVTFTMTFKPNKNSGIDWNEGWAKVDLNFGISQDYKLHLIAKKGHKPHINEMNMCKMISNQVLCFIAALQCNNVATKDIPASNLLNKKRIKKGKQPFFSYKVLTIDTKADTKQRKGGMGTGNTKRVHLRRGHIRRLPDKTVWVNPCVVGDKSKGMVTKDYKVK